MIHNQSLLSILTVNVLVEMDAEGTAKMFASLKSKIFPENRVNESTLVKYHTFENPKWILSLSF